VDVEKYAITFDDKGPAELAGRTLPVARNAEIRIDGKPGQLSGLTGAFLNLTLSVEQTSVRRIDAAGPYLGGCGGSPVQAIDVEKRTITFQGRGAPDVAGKTFVVAAEVNITIEGKPGTLAGVPPGAHANVGLSVDRQTVRQLNVQGPPALCDCGGSLVKAIDVDRRTLTFDERARAEVAGKTFTVAGDAFILIDGKPGTLAELPAGAYVDLTLSVDLRTARQVRARGPSVSGVVKAVDTEKNTVTVDDTTYPVTRDAFVVIDDKRKQLADLPTGATVNLALHVDRKTVGGIIARAP
jgi:hypothetical protein